MPDHRAYPSPSSPTILLHGRHLPLSETQARLLSVLLTCPGHVVPDAELLQLVPGVTLLQLKKRIRTIHEVMVPHGMTIHRAEHYGFVLLTAEERGDTMEQASASLLDLGIIFAHHIQAIPSHHVLIIDGSASLACTPVEYQLALQFLRHPGQAIPQSELRRGVADSTFREAIRSLRKKFETLGMTLSYVHVHGYALVSLRSPEESSHES
jgi:DNA-binding response OmpR family regulator